MRKKLGEMYFKILFLFLFISLLGKNTNAIEVTEWGYSKSFGPPLVDAEGAVANVMGLLVIKPMLIVEFLVIGVLIVCRIKRIDVPELKTFKKIGIAGFILILISSVFLSFSSFSYDDLDFQGSVWIIFFAIVITAFSLYLYFSLFLIKTVRSRHRVKTESSITSEKRK